MNNDIKLKPCPFCGGEVRIVVMDDEFNIRSKAYEKDPFSGLQYGLYHSEEENPYCPIATDSEEFLGVFGYDTKVEAIEAWNRRVENETD